MTKHAEKLLADAQRNIESGEGSYRKAAEAIAAAMAEDTTLSYATVGKRLDRSSDWVRSLVLWVTSDAVRATPWSNDSPARTVRAAKQVLRESPPEQIAEMLSDPHVRAKVSKAQDIAYDKINARSKRAYREAIGEDVADNLEYSQELQDLEHQLVKARGALAGFLRHANALEGDRPEGWVNECNAWLDDITYKVEMARGLLAGDDLADDLDKLLAGEV